MAFDSKLHNSYRRSKVKSDEELAKQHATWTEGQTSHVKIEKLMKELEDIKRLNFALWMLLQEKGFTNDELNSKIETTFEIDKKTSPEASEVFCEKCNNRMQRVGTFKVSCIYCGTTVTSNPYQLDFSRLNLVETDKEEYNKKVAHDLEIHHVPEEQFEPYDVTKDLHFDDEDIN